MEFKRLEQELFCLLKEVSKKKQQYDKTCAAYSLLLCPWPSKSADKAEAEESGQGDCKKNDKLDSREEAELKVVNDLLSKAVKAWKKMSPKLRTVEEDIAKPERDNTQDQALPNSNPPNQLWEICGADSAQTSRKNALNKSKTNAASDNSKKSAFISENKGTENILQSKDEKQCSVQGKEAHLEREMCSTGAALSSRPGSIKATPAGPRPTVSKSDEAQRPRSALNSQSSNTCPPSSRSKVKPAHMTAPFKTQPNMPVPKRQIKKPVAAVVQNEHRKHVQNTGTLTRNRGHNKVLPPIHTNDKNFHSCSGTPSSETQSDFQMGGGCSEPRLEKPENGKSDKGGMNINKNSVGVMTSGISEVTLSSRSELCKARQDPACQQTDLKSAGRQQGKDYFCLQTNGSSVNIPPSVRRAFAKNHQLRNKLQQRCTPHDQGGSPFKRGQEFISKLEKMFDCEEELIYRQRAWHCLHAHSRLLAVMEKLNLSELTDLWNVREVLHAKVMVEFILSSFSALSGEADLLSKIEFPQTTDPLLDALRRPRIWLSPHHQKNAQASACMGSHINYASEKQLCQFTSLQLSVQNLECQLHLLHLLTSDLIPGLEKAELQQDDVSTFRGIYSLATSCGEHSPALIHSAS